METTAMPLDQAGESVASCNRLADHLITLIQADRVVSFGQLVRRAAQDSATVACYEAQPRDYGDVRGANG